MTHRTHLVRRKSPWQWVQREIAYRLKVLYILHFFIEDMLETIYASMDLPPELLVLPLLLQVYVFYHMHIGDATRPPDPFLTCGTARPAPPMRTRIPWTAKDGPAQYSTPEGTEQNGVSLYGLPVASLLPPLVPPAPCP